MVRSYTGRKRFRKSFGRVKSAIQLPNLISLQNNSFESFLQYNVPPDKMENVGLLKIFNSFFPVVDSAGKSQLEFHGYSFEQPKYSELECKQRGGTYSASLKGKFSLIIWDKDEDTGERTVKDIKEQEVYLGDMPLMTDKSTFIFNGIERVVVSQMHRSPGVFISHDQGKVHASGKILFSARVIPYVGSWVDFEFDHRDLLYVRFDRRRKVLVTTFLMCLYSNETEEYLKNLNGEKPDNNQITGMSKEEILNTYYQPIIYKKVLGGWSIPFIKKQYKGLRLSADLINADTNEVVAKAGDKMTARALKLIEEKGLENVLVPYEAIYGKVIAKDLINEETGEIYCESGTPIDEELLKVIVPILNSEIEVLNTDSCDIGDFILRTIFNTKCLNREEALCELYSSLVQEESPTPAMGEELLQSMLWNPDKYDLSIVGRGKINDRLGLNIPDEVRTLQKQDIIGIIRLLCLVKNGHGEVDDIDNLGNRRIRSVGELIENQCRFGMTRLVHSIKEKLSTLEIDNYVPSDLINAKSLISSVKDFFVSSQLSQFMDQTNPLSEVTHKRRLSALGPGGLSRERAGFEVRDVHPTHYSRLCPVETPEGQNIGLICSTASYAKINKYGFLEAPYKRVIDGKVTNIVDYLTANEESKYIIAQSGVELNDDGTIKDDFVVCRKAGEIGLQSKLDVSYIDVSPQQVVSIAAALIPFLENDDASRALMGSNMQRQAVPLLRPDAPIVGTGIEQIVAQDSGSSVVAKRSGIVDRVEARRIVIRVNDENDAADIYPIEKFQCSNMGTCINQKPLVNVGDIINAGDIIADGPATNTGELALGKNLLVAFMSWNGYSYEDAIVLSERVIQEDLLTSVHIESFEVMARDTKLGNEEITRDIPNLAEESLKNLDESGIVYVGAEVNPGDILVGKITPKGETVMTPEEKLLRAIFGEKSADVKDSSFRVPPGIYGTVVEVRVLMRKGIDKDERTEALDRQHVEELARDRDAEINIFEQAYTRMLREKLLGQHIVSGINGYENSDIDAHLLSKITIKDMRNIKVSNPLLQISIQESLKNLDKSISKIQAHFADMVYKLKKGDELPASVLKIVKVFVAQKRKILVGDKMAGRHGNKGVVSKILPIEDMPYLEDGTPVDIILNPLGLPSRMNLGQIFETYLGAAAHELGVQIKNAFDEYKANKLTLQDVRNKVMDIYDNEKDNNDIKELSDNEFEELVQNIQDGVPVASPVFDGASVTDIETLLEKAGLDKSGQRTVYDGRTGLPFDRKVTVGYKYMLKLHHLVDDKMHSRSVGPYSLITQQPLGGKAQFGGQRFGEMEVWALEAHGAAYTLLEMLTVKSDDVAGRSQVYSNIIKGDTSTAAYGYPESWHVLLKELNALGLNLTFELNDNNNNEQTQINNDNEQVNV